MSNRIQIRHGINTPMPNSLLPYELGYLDNENSKSLYIGGKDGIPIELINTQSIKSIQDKINIKNINEEQVNNIILTKDDYKNFYALNIEDFINSYNLVTLNSLQDFQISINSLPIIPLNKGGTGAENATQAANNLEVLSLNGGIMRNSIDMGNNAIINLPDPTQNNQAATKQYVDNKLGNISSFNKAELLWEGQEYNNMGEGIISFPRDANKTYSIFLVVFYSLGYDYISYVIPNDTMTRITHLYYDAATRYTRGILIFNNNVDDFTNTPAYALQITNVWSNATTTSTSYNNKLIPVYIYGIG